MSETKTNNSIYMLSISTVLIFFISLYNQYLIIPALVLLPALISKIIYEYSVWDGVYSALAILIFSLLSVFVTGTNYTYTILVLWTMVVLPGFVIGISFSKRLCFKDMLIISFITESVLVLIAFAFIKYFYNADITSAVRTSLIDTYLQFVEFIEVYYPEMLTVFKSDKYMVFNIFYTVMPGLVPFVLMLSGFVFFVLRYVTSKIILKKAFIIKSDFIDGIDKFKLSRTASIVFIASLIITLSGTQNKTAMIALNILLIIIIMYFFEAAALLNYKLKQTSASYSRRIAVFAFIIAVSVVATFVFPVVNVFYLGIFIGFLDSIFDYRKLNSKEGATHEK